MSVSQVVAPGSPERVSGTPSVLALPGASEQLRVTLTQGLAAVNALLEKRIDHADPSLRRPLVIWHAGGKRFRPLLTILASELGSGVNDQVVGGHRRRTDPPRLALPRRRHGRGGRAVERRAPTRHTTTPRRSSSVTSFGTASDIVADLGPEAVKIQAQTFIRLCAGQIRDDRPAPADADLPEYYRGVLADKTGVLIATAARYGAMFGGCPPEVVATMRVYGEHLGMAFQLADDLIDIASDAEETGKTPGTDLREGKRTCR